MIRPLTPKQVLSRLRTSRRAITVLDRVVISPDAEGRKAIAAEAKRQRCSDEHSRIRGRLSGRRDRRTGLVCRGRRETLRRLTARYSVDGESLMAVIVTCWRGPTILPQAHGDVLVAAYSNDALVTRDHALHLLDLALTMAGQNKGVEELREAIAEDEEAAMIEVVERATRKSSVPAVRQRR